MTRRAYTPGQGPGLELMLALVCAACGVAALLLGAGGLVAAIVAHWTIVLLYLII